MKNYLKEIDVPEHGRNNPHLSLPGVKQDLFMRATVVIDGNRILKNRFGNEGLIINDRTRGFKIAKFLRLI